MKKNIVVLGGGIAGIEAAISLRKKGYEVTLISDREDLFIYPVSIWIPTREMDFKDVTISLEKLKKIHGFNLIIDRVQSIQAEANRVHLEKRGIHYDYLIIALGADKMKINGIEHTISICGQPDQSIRLRDRMDELIRKGKGKIAFGFGGNPQDPAAVRGGPAYELIFNTLHLLKKKGIRDQFELTFFAPMENPGAKMGDKALKINEKFFKNLKIHTRFGVKINQFVSDGVIFEDGSKLESDLMMFIPGAKGKKEMIDSDLPLNNAGFIQINEQCQVKGFENIFAIGDNADIEGPAWRAKQGHLAEAMAKVAAENIDAIERKSNKRKSYLTHMNIICVMDTGNGAAFIYRDGKRDFTLPLPIVGHWLKKGWRHYYRLSKLRKKIFTSLNKTQNEPIAD